MCFFFFQAEDGIRDRNVTGVQTCALPIYFLLRKPQLTAHAYDRLSRELGLSQEEIGRRTGKDRTSIEIGRASCRERRSIGGGDRVGENEKSVGRDQVMRSRPSGAEPEKAE